MKLPDRVITWAAILTAAFLAARLLFPGQHTDALETALADQRAVNVRAEARNTRASRTSPSWMTVWPRNAPPGFGPPSAPKPRNGRRKPQSAA